MLADSGFGDTLSPMTFMATVQSLLTFSIFKVNGTSILGFVGGSINLIDYLFTFGSNLKLNLKETCYDFLAIEVAVVAACLALWTMRAAF